MSNDDRDVHILLRRNLQRQLEGFDLDRQRQTVMQRLAGTRIQKPHRVIPIGVAVGVAAILMLAVGYLSMSLLRARAPIPSLRWKPRHSVSLWRAIPFWLQRIQRQFY